MKIFQLALIEQLFLPEIDDAFVTRHFNTISIGRSCRSVSIEIRLQQNTRVSVFVCCISSSSSCPHTFRWGRYHVAHLPRPPSCFCFCSDETGGRWMLHCSAARVFSGRWLVSTHRPHNGKNMESLPTAECWLQAATPFLQLPFLLFVCPYHLQNRAITRPSCWLLLLCKALRCPFRHLLVFPRPWFSPSSIKGKGMQGNRAAPVFIAPLQ